MSVEVMRSVIDAAEGRVPVDTLFTNAQIVDVYGQRVAPGSVAVKDGVIVGVLYDGRYDAAGTYEAAASTRNSPGGRISSSTAQFLATRRIFCTTKRRKSLRTANSIVSSTAR